MRDFKPRDARIFRPYPDEIPWELLHDEESLDASNPSGTEYPEDARMRVAKFDGDVIGVYVIVPVTALSFCLLNLVVAREYRGRGLGRWLLGHAIGLAESKGAREIIVRGQLRRRFFAGVGFEADGADLKLILTPE